MAVRVEVVDADVPPRAYGGRFDTVARVWCGPPRSWVTWQVGAGQLPPLDASRGRFVCVGAMGAGKTEILARACILAAILRGRNMAIGVVAPTQKRLRIIWAKVTRLLAPAWVLETRLSDSEITLINGCKLQFVAAKIHSADVGSPIQGYSWIEAFVDEEQDVDDEAMADVLMRGRDAPNGDYRVVSSCTLKDTPAWRERKRRYEAEPDTVLYRMAATANPFVAAEYWQELRARLTERQYRMRVLALDARPERAVYPEFDAALHVSARPLVGARDVTRAIVGRDVLIGYDPGTLFDVSIFLKAYQRSAERDPTWYVIGELTTEQTTTDAHAIALAKSLAHWGYTPADALMVGDPYGDREDTNRPHVTVYKVFVSAGFKIRPAAYSTNMRGASKPGVVPKDAGIELVNTLLKNASGQTRLYVDVATNGTPVAPRLVAAMEMSERDESGRAERQKKTKQDLSHWPAALRYALWPFERIRLAEPSWKDRIRNEHSPSVGIQ